MRKYSVIIPVYNRPDEVDELLASLCEQTFTNFDILVIEDGSSHDCKAEVEKYADQLDITYYAKENEGQGFTRNFGFERATGDYLIVFDSDALVPPHYFEAVEKHLNEEWLDVYGGPDAAHESFTPMQKAISYSMTSPFTTGGIRGGKKQLGKYEPRSFNMGISREVFERTKGYVITRMGEDVEFSQRIRKEGFTIGLIPEAYIYHKRRTNLKQFWKQLHFFGRARINLTRWLEGSMKLFHAFPAFFLIGLLVWPFTYLFSVPLFFVGAVFIAVFSLGNFIDSSIKNKSLYIGALSVVTSFTQLLAYGAGFLQEGIKRPFENTEASRIRQRAGEKV